MSQLPVRQTGKRRELKADAPAFVPGPCSSGESPQEEEKGAELGFGDEVDGGDDPGRDSASFRTPERQPRPEQGADVDALKSMKGLHVDVPPANNDVLRILDAVPFTPSQGIRTPSPKNMAALRTFDGPEGQSQSKLSVMSNRQEMPSPPFSPTYAAMHFDQRMQHQPSPPFSPTYGSMPSFEQPAMVQDPNAMMAESLRGQLLHQMFFGYSSSPPSPPSNPHAYHWSLDPRTASPPHIAQPGSPPTQLPPHMPMYGHHTYPAGFPSSSHMPVQPTPAPVYGPQPVHRNLFPSDFSIPQQYSGMAPMPAPPPPSIPQNPIQLRAPMGPQINGNVRRNHMSSRFRQGSPLRAGNGAAATHMGQTAPFMHYQTHSRHSGPNAPYHHGRQTIPPHNSHMKPNGPPHPNQQQQLPHQTFRSGLQRNSTESTPSSSMNSSPSAPGMCAPGTDPGKPRMNARQRRTERRRREREIKTILEHVEEMEGKGEGLDGEDRRVFDFQLSEVQTLMSQVQHQQQDNGEGALIEYHLRKLRSLIKLEEPAAEEGEEVSPGVAAASQDSAATSKTPAKQQADSAVGSALASAFQEQMRLAVRNLEGGSQGAPEATVDGLQMGADLTPSAPAADGAAATPSTA